MAPLWIGQAYAIQAGRKRIIVRPDETMILFQRLARDLQKH